MFLVYWHAYKRVACFLKRSFYQNTENCSILISIFVPEYDKIVKQREVHFINYEVRNVCVKFRSTNA